MSDKTEYERDRRAFTLRFLREGRLIQRNRDVLSGSYTIRGTRLSVRWIRGMHRGGDSIRSIARNYYLPEAVVRYVVEEWRKS